MIAKSINFKNIKISGRSQINFNFSISSFQSVSSEFAPGLQVLRWQPYSPATWRSWTEAPWRSEWYRPWSCWSPVLATKKTCRVKTVGFLPVYFRFCRESSLKLWHSAVLNSTIKAVGNMILLIIYRSMQRVYQNSAKDT